MPPEGAGGPPPPSRERGIDLWVFADNEWYVTDPAGFYVPKERHTVQFEPTVVAAFGDHLDRAGKLVASSQDFDLLAETETELQAMLGDTAAAHRSQLYYLDVTNPVADKGHAVKAFARHFGVPMEEVAVIGDMANDLPMFDVAGLAIAMGNALPPVRCAGAFRHGLERGGWRGASDRGHRPAAGRGQVLTQSAAINQLLRLGQISRPCVAGMPAERGKVVPF